MTAILAGPAGAAAAGVWAWALRAKPRARVRNSAENRFIRRVNSFRVSCSFDAPWREKSLYLLRNHAAFNKKPCPERAETRKDVDGNINRNRMNYRSAR
jgi:hypothetical protein